MALFPVGHLDKSQVRNIAREQKLSTAEKKDSQGICFVGKVDLPAFLRQKLESRTGNIIEIPENLSIYSDYKEIINDHKHLPARLKEITAGFSYSRSDGTEVGTHEGAHYFTIGQNKGLNIGGRPEQSFVIAIDVRNNIIYTGQGQNHPGLYRKGLFIPPEDIHWLREDLKMAIGDTRDYLVRIRYRQPLQKAALYMKEVGLYILFDNLQRGITSGQFAAWYDGDELLGSGVIF